jgi:hypothetical protein
MHAQFPPLENPEFVLSNFSNKKLKKKKKKKFLAVWKEKAD